MQTNNNATFLHASLIIYKDLASSTQCLTLCEKLYAVFVCFY